MFNTKTLTTMVTKSIMSAITSNAHEIMNEENISWGAAMRRAWADYHRWLDKKQRVYMYGSLKMKREFAERYGISGCED